jgi:nucleotide-binding universal stress UspA family protein
MALPDEPKIAEPGADELAFGDGPSFRRVLVPIRSAADAEQTLAVAAHVCHSTHGTLRLLYVRIFDPPTRGYGRFYPQTQSEAAAVADEALPIVWAYGVQATTSVVDAPRGGISAAIAQQAAAWRADVIVMTRRPHLAICSFLLGSVADQVMRKASCPVLAVHPRPKVPQRHAARDD